MVQGLPTSLNSSDSAPTVHLGYQTDKPGKVIIIKIILDKTNAEVEETSVDTNKALLDFGEHSTNSDSEKKMKMKYKTLRFYVGMLHIDVFKIKLYEQLYIQ